jgi:hypothetical protein
VLQILFSLLANPICVQEPREVAEEAQLVPVPGVCDGQEGEGGGGQAEGPQPRQVEGQVGLGKSDFHSGTNPICRSPGDEDWCHAARSLQSLLPSGLGQKVWDQLPYTQPSLLSTEVACQTTGWRPSPWARCT